MIVIEEFASPVIDARMKTDDAAQRHTETLEALFDAGFDPQALPGILSRKREVYVDPASTYRSEFALNETESILIDSNTNIELDPEIVIETENGTFSLLDNLIFIENAALQNPSVIAIL
jgi:hypothetical protein